MQEEITQREVEALDAVWHRLTHLIHRVSEEVWRDLRGMTMPEIAVLNIIETKPDVILKDIIRILNIPNSTLTSTIDRLEKRGLIRREISQRDRRSFGIVLTEEGRAAQDEHKRGEAILWKRVLGAYDTAKERMELIENLEKMADHLTVERTSIERNDHGR